MKRGKKNSRKIKAIVFDIGGVLFLGDKKVKYKHQNINVHEYLAKKFNLTLKKWLDTIDLEYLKAITGKKTKKTILQSLSKKLNTTPSKLEKLFVRAHKKYFSKNKELFKTAKELKKQGYTVGIFSDQTYFSKEAIIHSKDFKIFKPIFISCDLGMRKPEKKFYVLLRKELNKIKKISYSEIVFIDNREWNLKPAKKLGMKTILYKNNEQTLKELNKILNKEFSK